MPEHETRLLLPADASELLRRKGDQREGPSREAGQGYDDRADGDEENGMS